MEVQRYSEKMTADVVLQNGESLQSQRMINVTIIFCLKNNL